ncbi:diacylglycerol kinase family protein [Litchfieldia alkalitelluris]|uniref:diacylglycerol kinase family protein n=1 Tax=Litchfieldia alkalitelluris TaxID=304268 RepID=UPI001116C16D|nr:diacylglycerol kinase family protein [Litchfieldia alkalitelluris]
MGSRDNRQPHEWLRLVKSFEYAINGLKNAILKERNLQIHLVLSILVILLSFYCKIAIDDWIIVIIMIGGVIVLELINTAIERVVDLVTTDFHPLAKLAKDVSAAAVLVFSFIAVIVGILIFTPYLF